MQTSIRARQTWPTPSFPGVTNGEKKAPTSAAPTQGNGLRRPLAISTHALHADMRPLDHLRLPLRLRSAPQGAVTSRTLFCALYGSMRPFDHRRLTFRTAPEKGDVTSRTADCACTPSMATGLQLTHLFSTTRTEPVPRGLVASHTVTMSSLHTKTRFRTSRDETLPGCSPRVIAAASSKLSIVSGALNKRRSRTGLSSLRPQAVKLGNDRHKKSKHHVRAKT